jgi:hypothetical protein
VTTPQGKGRYGDYDVLTQADHWDEVTREVVLARVGDPGPLRFFDEAQARTLQAFLDVVLAQDYEPRVPLLAMVDAKLADGKLDGFRYAEMPDDRETWRQLARGLDQSCFPAGGGGFADATEPVRRGVVEGLSAGTLRGGVWERLPPSLVWQVVMRAALSEFYSHPWAWNEIGFGGPAYPRGYARLSAGQRESWEHAEVDSE